MKLIIGLGNPGKEYKSTRHNVGFFAIDKLTTDYGLTTNDRKKKFNGEYCETNINGEKIIFCKPQTFMNKSGESVGLLSNFYKISPANILIIHDEIDFPTAKIQLKFGGSAAGHNGLKSIIANLGTTDFRRIRIGIDRPTDQEMVADYVLTNFPKKEILAIQKKSDEIEKLISQFIKE